MSLRFIVVQKLTAKILLSTDFCESQAVNIDFPSESVYFCNHGVRIPMVQQRVSREASLPSSVIFVSERERIPPYTECVVGVEIDITDPLCSLSQTGFVTDREHVCAHSSLRVAPGMVRTENGKATVVIANFGPEPIFLQEKTAVGKFYHSRVQSVSRVMAWR